MRVGIDIRVLAHGARTGVEAYVTSLLEHFAGKNPDVEFRLFYNAWRKEPPYFLAGRGGFLSGLKVPTVIPVRRTNTNRGSPSASAFGAGRWRAGLADAKGIAAPLQQNLRKNTRFKSSIFLHESSIPNRLLEAAFFVGVHPKVDKILGGADVLFSPHIVGAETSTSCPRVLTVHDLSFVRHPEFFSLGKRLWHMMLRIKKQLSDAETIIAVSYSTKRDLMEIFGVPEEKIRVIYSGVERRFYRRTPPEAEQQTLQEKYRLPERFILFLGTIEPRKNIPTLIQAYTILRDRYTDFENTHLVLAGASGWLKKDIFTKAAQSPHASAIHFPGFIDEKDRPALFNLAELFVFPSIFEGFGFPPLEAMASGIPTIVSNRASLPEVVGDGALLVDPHDPDALAEAMAMMLRDQELRRHYRERGIARAQQFSWDDTAEKTLAVLQETAGK